MVSMATTNNKQPQAVFFKSLLHSSNLPTMVHMEMKLCAHMYFIVSMTTVNKKCPQALFPITTSSLLKLANHAMHGAETWYACVFEHFHDNHWPKIASGTFSSSLLKLAHHTMHGGETRYACVFQCFHDNHWQKIASGTFPYNYFFISQTCKPCNAWSWNLVRMCIWAFPWQPLTKKLPQALFPVTTSSLLKLAHHTMHGGETLYACVFQCFHDNHWQKHASGTSQTCKPCNAWSWNLVRMCIWAFPWQPLTKIASGTFSCNYFFTSQTCTPYNAWRWNLVHMCISAFPWQPLTLKTYTECI